MTLDDALMEACRAVQINPPKRALVPGKWVRSDTYERNGKGDAGVLLLDDKRGVSTVNWQTMMRKTVWTDGRQTDTPPPPDPKRAKQEAEEREAVARICAQIVKACRQDKHPYLAAKGFPDELGLVHDNPRQCLPPGRFWEDVAYTIPSGPVLVVPGRIGGKITTLQFIAADGTKKNIKHGAMVGASHRIATGERSVVCEGIGTAMSVRAALRLLGVSASVYSAFAAANVKRVAEAMPGALIAADHDKPLEQLGGKGTGEFYAIASGCRWVMPPALEDYNDMHMREGLRAVALHLRGALMG